MNDQPPAAMTIVEFLDVSKTARASIARLWLTLSPQEMQAIPGPQADWSVKDLISHLLWWENYAITRLMLLAAGGQVAALRDFDALNHQVFLAHRDLPLDWVLQEWERNWQRLEAFARTHSDTSFNDASHDPQNERSPYRLLGGNTVGHYMDHQPDLEQYVASLGK